MQSVNTPALCVWKQEMTVGAVKQTTWSEDVQLAHAWQDVRVCVCIEPLGAGVVVALGQGGGRRGGAGRGAPAALQAQHQAQEQTENQGDNQVALTVRHLQQDGQLRRVNWKMADFHFIVANILHLLFNYHRK